MIVSVLVYQAFVVEGPQEFKHIAWGFFVIGIGLILTRWLALKYWVGIQARIIDVQDGDDAQDVKFVYEFEGQEYIGYLQETGMKKKGEWITIQVNPDKPESNISITIVTTILGLGFIGVSIATLLSIE